jgi:hypothetical protein
VNPRWLLNENYPQPSVLRLRELGWDIAAIGEDTPSIDDEQVMARACSEGRWLATFDRDYGELVFKRRLVVPALILLLRVPSYLPKEPAAWMWQMHANGEFREGYFHIFDGRAVRRRPFFADQSGGSH